MAILTGVEASVALHISRGDDLNARDGEGRTPLMLCALRNRRQICALLLSAGANTGLKSLQGKTAYEIAVEKGNFEVAVLLAPEKEQLTVETLIGIDSPIPTSAEEHVGECGSTTELDTWEPEEEKSPPPASPELAVQVALIHKEISHHSPQDFSTDWGDIDAYLPDQVQTPTRLGDDDIRSALRLIFLRGIREGSVPDMGVEDIAEILDTHREHDLASHLRRILGDIGAETDERFEYATGNDDFTVHVEQKASEQEEDVISEALLRLDSVVSRRYEPIRQYLRSIQGHPLLTAAEEAQLGQTMESSLQQAIDLVATDAVAVQHVLDAVRQVQTGARKFASISRGWKDPHEADNQIAPDEQQHAALVAAPDHEVEPDGDVDDPDGDVGAQLASIVQGLEKHLSTETPRTAEQDLLAVLNLLRLSRGFLFELAEASVAWRSVATEAAFREAMRSYRQAHDRMTTSNLKLVLSIAKKYVYSGLPLEDLVQEGNLGLIKAVERYDWRKGFRFSTFAIWWIRQQIGRSVADTGRTVRLPVHVHEKVQALRWMIRGYEAAEGRLPPMTTMVDAMNMRADKVASLMTYMEDILPIQYVDVDTLADPEFIARFHSDEPEDLASRSEEAGRVAQLLESFPRKQRNILRLRYGIGVRDFSTLEEVGQGMGVTRERVRQIESKALALLRHPARTDWLDGRPSTHKRRPEEPLDAESSHDAVPIAEAAHSSKIMSPRKDRGTTDRNSHKERRSQIDQVLAQSRLLEIEVDDDRDGNTGRVWVNLNSHNDPASRKLVRRMLDLGFEHCPGKGYWK